MRCPIPRPQRPKTTSQKEVYIGYTIQSVNENLSWTGQGRALERSGLPLCAPNRTAPPDAGFRGALSGAFRGPWESIAPRRRRFEKCPPPTWCTSPGPNDLGGHRDLPRSIWEGLGWRLGMDQKPGLAFGRFFVEARAREERRIPARQACFNWEIAISWR